MTTTGPERRWAADRDVDFRRIWEHLLRQRDVDIRRYVRLDDGRVVRVGSEAEGEDA